MPYIFSIRSTYFESSALPVASSAGAARYLYTHCFRAEDMWRESCFALFLNSRNEITGHQCVTTGTDSSTIVDHKAICAVALNCFAKGVILAHNHPSGSCKPSTTDIRETGKLKKALALFDINLLDHIIVTEKEFYSFAEEKTFKYTGPKAPKSEPVDIFTPEDIERLNNTMKSAFAAPIL